MMGEKGNCVDKCYMSEFQISPKHRSTISITFAVTVQAEYHDGYWSILSIYYASLATQIQTCNIIASIDVRALPKVFL